MSICPHCGKHTPTTNEKLRGMFAARVEKSAKVNRRNADAAHNEMATAMHAINAEDVIDPRSACPDGPRAVGFVEFKPGEEPERFDEATGPMGGGL